MKSVELMRRAFALVSDFSQRHRKLPPFSGVGLIGMGARPGNLVDREICCSLPIGEK